MESEKMNQRDKRGMLLRVIEVCDPDFVAYAAKRGGWCPTPECLTRPVCITPYAGDFGLAGYAIVVNGSPSKLSIFIDFDNRRAVISGMNGAKVHTQTGPSSTLRVIIDFLKKHEVDLGRYARVVL
jgi:hypothetical protein